jgi:hypothetical protein
VSLWEIVKKLIATNISELFSQIVQLQQVASTSPPSEQVPKPWRNYIANTVGIQGTLFTADLGLSESTSAAARFYEDLRRDDTFTNQELLWKLDGLRELMESEMSKKLFFSVPDSVAMYYGKERPFGESVFLNFPSARFDISQAGTCLACGCHTAAGFHLMRTAEVGLWELGRDRQVPSAKNSKIEFQEWGVTIGELESAVKAIQQWPNSPSKENAHKFYNSSLVELRAFNDGWRRHIAHVRKTHKPLEEDETIALWGHVYRFMNTLAAQIGEGRYKPLVWT